MWLKGPPQVIYSKISYFTARWLVTWVPSAKLLHRSFYFGVWLNNLGVRLHFWNSAYHTWELLVIQSLALSQIYWIRKSQSGVQQSVCFNFSWSTFSSWFWSTHPNLWERREVEESTHVVWFQKLRKSCLRGIALREVHFGCGETE